MIMQFSVLFLTNYKTMSPSQSQTNSTMFIIGLQMIMFNQKYQSSKKIKVLFISYHLEYSALFENHKMMKHKFYDKYYIGEWD